MVIFMQTFNQYLVVIIANTIRFGFDIFNTTQVGKYFIGTCPSDDDHEVLEIIFNAVTTLLTFYLPVFIVLRIYNL